MYPSPGMVVLYENENKEETGKIVKSIFGTQIGERDILFLDNGKQIFIEQVKKYAEPKGEFVQFELYKSSSPIKSFQEWLSECKSYKDVDKWFKENFKFEHEKFKKAWHKNQGGLRYVAPRSPEETYNLRYGACQDFVRMAKSCLKRINPEYNVRILTLEISDEAIHFLCTFDLGDGIYLIEYGSWAYNMHGIWGPFKDEKEIVNDWYLKLHPRHRTVRKYYWGWPSLDFFKKET